MVDTFEDRRSCKVILMPFVTFTISATMFISPCTTMEVLIEFITNKKHLGIVIIDWYDIFIFWLFVFFLVRITVNKFSFIPFALKRWIVMKYYNFVCFWGQRSMNTMPVTRFLYMFTKLFCNVLKSTCLNCGYKRYIPVIEPRNPTRRK